MSNKFKEVLRSNLCIDDVNVYLTSFILPFQARVFMLEAFSCGPKAHVRTSVECYIWLIHIFTPQHISLSI